MFKDDKKRAMERILQTEQAESLIMMMRNERGKKKWAKISEVGEVPKAKMEAEMSWR